MILATSQDITDITVIVDGASGQNPDDMIDYTFDTSTRSGSASLTYVIELDVQEVEYVGIAGHNLATLGATITINNHGTNDVLDYAPVDGRPLMFQIPKRLGGTFRITFTKTSASDRINISHIAAGQITDLTGTTNQGQVINRDYQGGYGRIPMNLNRKIRTVINDQGAPTASLVKTTSSKLRLSINNMPTLFAQNELLTYQRFWVNNGFFIQNDEDVSQSYMAFEFIPAVPKAHNASRELVNLSYSFMAYNGQ